MNYLSFETIFIIDYSDRFILEKKRKEKLLSDDYDTVQGFIEIFF